MRRFDVWFLVLAISVGVLWFLPRLLPRFTVPRSSEYTPDEKAALLKMNRVLTKDDILPVYDPKFVPASEARIQPDELVLGLKLNGDARAYSITVLNGREMVNDVVGGVPVLVTW
ncbi:MAG: DUF3179 domain-containing protein [Armatimonadetes bacterium]|nr:DUF3179 domain-containing protein [Armatimonadota bacterium]